MCLLVSLPYINVRVKDKKDNTAIRVLALHTANPVLIPITLHGPMISDRSDPKCRIRIKL